MISEEHRRLTEEVKGSFETMVVAIITTKDVGYEIARKKFDVLFFYVATSWFNYISEINNDKEFLLTAGYLHAVFGAFHADLISGCLDDMSIALYLSECNKYSPGVLNYLDSKLS